MTNERMVAIAFVSCSMLMAFRGVLYADGKQFRRSTTYHPSPELTPAGNKAVAMKFAESFLLEVKKELPPQKSIKDITFGEYFNEKYKAKAKVYFAPTTFRFYMNTINNLFLEEYKDIPLKDITKAMVQETVVALSKKMNENLIDEDDDDPESRITIKGQTVKRYMTAYRSLINFAIYDGIIATDPFVGGFRYPRFEPKNVVCLDELDFKEIIKDLYKKISGPVPTLERNDVMVATAVFSGVRRGELVALRWKNILNLNEESLNRVQIDISYSASKTTGVPQKIGTTKSFAGVRSFTIPRFLAEVLWTWKGMMIAKNGYVSEDDFIISDGCGAMVSVYSPTKWFKGYLKDHGLRAVKLHSLRHTFASMMHETGIDPYILQYLMGHKKFSTTEIYLQSFKVKKGNIMQTFNEYTKTLIHNEEEENEN